MFFGPLYLKFTKYFKYNRSARSKTGIITDNLRMYKLQNICILLYTYLCTYKYS